jgi:hypothetical protein
MLSTATFHIQNGHGTIQIHPNSILTYFRSEEIALEFRIKRVKVPLVEGQSQPDASNRHRYMTVKDYNIKENNVIAMVKKQVIEVFKPNNKLSLSISSRHLPTCCLTRVTRKKLTHCAELQISATLIILSSLEMKTWSRAIASPWLIPKLTTLSAVRSAKAYLSFRINNSDLYLQRLITSKHILQPYVDMFFNYILIDEANTSVPPPIKYLFDFLDKSARNTVRHGTITSQVDCGDD